MVVIRMSEYYHSQSTEKKRAWEKKTLSFAREVIITLYIAATDRCQCGDGRGERVKEF